MEETFIYTKTVVSDLGSSATYYITILLAASRILTLIPYENIIKLKYITIL